MPAVSEAQRKLMAIAEHDPSKLYPENKGIAQSMSKGQLHDFAATKGKLPQHKSRRGDGANKRSGHGRHKRGRGA
jgi:hypothetical protein